MGLAQILEVGRRALLTQQLTLNTIGHNIANVDTPGYTRQRVGLSSTDPLKTILGAVGTGVQVSDIRHIRDLFLGTQWREENKSLGKWTYREKILGQIETMFNEPSDDSLRGHMDNFWNSWSQLANAPESSTNRNDLISKASILVSEFHQLSNQLNALKDSVDRDLTIRVQDINRLTSGVASLNTEISRTELGGSSANDLRDRRDLLIDELSTLVDVNVVEEAGGAARVYIGSMTLVDRNISYKIGTDTKIVNGSSLSELVLQGSPVVIKNINGELRGLVETRDKVIPSYLSRLDELAQTIATQVNAVHSAGFGLASAGLTTAPTGNDFFNSTSISAATISINLAVLNDPTLIAASQSGEPGDASNALAMTALRDGRLMNNNSISFSDFYGSLVGDVGIAAQEANRLRSNFELVVQQIDNARQSVQGVSLDEEMTNLIRAQRAYEAAARVITTVDQAYDTIINGMGIVGR